MNFLEYIAHTRGELLVKTVQHLMLTGISATVAILVGVPLGTLITRWRAWRGVVLGLLGVVQTVPSVAMLAILMIPLGLGAQPAIAALILYALLPIVVNTYTGLAGVDRNIVEAADGVGFTPLQRLWMVELPLASPVIIAGIRTSTVIMVGIATLSALIGAGGLGDFIFRGLSTGSNQSIMLGVIAASFMAIVLGWAMGVIEKTIRRRLHQQ